MFTIRNILFALRGDDKGVTAIEYGLIATLVAVGLIAGATTLGGGLDTMFNDLGGKMSGG
ncbi:Flp family type IVb pilin [uncultured Rhodospira sp.]|uniref:Flp family type IVb pilin n=1 Tax=uncultured Rhodospira sp. TaxID=1936189 RepID=UPI0026320CEB|nr:Flp family type IVb pilin [uncultured Rhodospira sp.]